MVVCAGALCLHPSRLAGAQEAGEAKSHLVAPYFTATLGFATGPGECPGAPCFPSAPMVFALSGGARVRLASLGARDAGVWASLGPEYARIPLFISDLPTPTAWLAAGRITVGARKRVAVAGSTGTFRYIDTRGRIVQWAVHAQYEHGTRVRGRHAAARDASLLVSAHGGPAAVPAAPRRVRIGFRLLTPSWRPDRNALTFSRELDTRPQRDDVDGSSCASHRSGDCGLGLFPVPLASAVPCNRESDDARCRCVVDPDFSAMTRARFERAEAVFRATIVRIDTVAGPIGVLRDGPRSPWTFAARLRVTESWKGTVGDTTMLMLSRSTSCDASLTWDSVYVVFALRGADGRLTTRQCTGTTELRSAERTLRVLGPGRLSPQ